MPNQMTSYQKGLVKQLKSNAEKYVRARSQAEYLEECISKNILPRSINLVRLVKSSSLWENNANETFEILFETSLKLIQDQLNEKRERYEKLDRESRELRSLLKSVNPAGFELTVLCSFYCRTGLYPASSCIELSIKQV